VSKGDLLDRAVSIAVLARRSGADAAETYLSRFKETEIRVRGGRIERTTEAAGLGCGLRVDRGLRQGFASTTDLSPSGLDDLVSAALAIADRVPEDPHGPIPEAQPGTLAALDLFDQSVDTVDFDRCVKMARAVEEAALAADPRVTAGEGSVYAQAQGEVAIASTRGAAVSHEATSFSLACQPVAEAGGERQRLTWHESRRFLSDLPPPEVVGSTAAERAARMLGARPLQARRAPVVMDPLMASRFWAQLAPAFLGDAARRRVSFLADELGRAVAASGVSLAEDSVVPRAPGSRPFDGEGWPTARRMLIDRGVLTSFLYDSRSARRAGVATTGNAVRGYTSPPSPGAHALRLRAGSRSPREILEDVGKALYVTHVIGFGVNLVTGDYSRGANGWWYENGEFAHPVHEVTISGNLRDMLRGIVAIGDDLVLRSAVSSPTFMIDEMVISGSAR
jgi:PmbA protein